MSNKGFIIKECERANMARRVCAGKVDCNTFFGNVRGHLLMSGIEVNDIGMLGDLICEYAARRDMPTIVLAGHYELLKHLAERQQNGGVAGIMISEPDSRNYHLMYGMSNQQINRLISLAGEEKGYRGAMDGVLSYAAALLNIVEVQYPASLPALSALLKEDDDCIASLASQMGLSNVIANNILGNHEAGIVLRRIVEHLEEVFEGVALSDNETKYNFQSGCQGGVPVMAFYQVSNNQKLMNAYLKEELYGALKRVPKLRVILDEVLFLDERDELLTYLLQMKRQGKVELIALSENVKNMLPGAALDFGNICLFLHANTTAMEDISKDLFGTYPYHYPVCVAGGPPAMIMTLKKDKHWHADKEDRLRIREQDLCGEPQLFGNSCEKMAIKTTSNNNIYLVPVKEFMIYR